MLDALSTGVLNLENISPAMDNLDIARHRLDLADKIPDMPRYYEARSALVMEAIEEIYRAAVKLQAAATIKDARFILRTALEHDADFRRSYVDNIACVILDACNGGESCTELFGDKDARDTLAIRILNVILGVKEPLPRPTMGMIEKGKTKTEFVPAEKEHL